MDYSNAHFTFDMDNHSLESQSYYSYESADDHDNDPSMSFSIGEIGTLPTLMFSVGGDYHDTSQSEDFDAELDLSYESQDNNVEEFDEEISDYEEQVGREHYVDNSLDMGSDSEGSINSRRGYNSPVFGSKEALTSSEIASFPTMFWQQLHNYMNEGEKCSCCLQDYQIGDNLRVVPCMHRFHSDCIDQWLVKKANCPLCKQDFRFNDN